MKPTDWVNSLVCATKRDGTIRLCLDPKDLNRAIKRPHHCTPTLEEVLSRLANTEALLDSPMPVAATGMSSLTTKALYTQPLTPHMGDTDSLRLPFGLICAPRHLPKEGRRDFRGPPWCDWHC